MITGDTRPSPFPDAANLIIPQIWLGNRKAAADNDFLRKNNITVIVNASKNIPFSELPGLYKYRVPVDDNLEDEEIDNMSRWAPEIVYTILQHYFRGDNILIHCAAGMQRSAAIVAMTLIVLCGFTADEALAFIREKRRIAFFPAANFKRSIRSFEMYYHNTLIPLLRRRNSADAPTIPIR